MMLTYDKAHEIATLKSEDCCCAPLVWSDCGKEILSLCGLHNRHVFDHGTRGWKSQIKVPEAQVSCGDLSALKTAGFSLRHHVGLECGLWCHSLSYKGTSSPGLGLHSYGLF